MKHALAIVPALVALLGSGALAEDAPAVIPFEGRLADAYAAAKEQDKPLLICVNSRRVDGGRLEPAARELRENTYRDPTVAALATRFVCALLTGESTAEDFGELRARYGIDGDIVSPQHIFAYPDGKLIFRKEYWPHAAGEPSVAALKELMEKALASDASRRGAPPAEGALPGGPEGGAPDEGGIPACPQDPEARAAWIATSLGLARSADQEVRRAALGALVAADREGDTVGPLLLLLEESKKDAATAVDIVRAFGRPGLEAAREAVEACLDARDDLLRGNAAVSLEYIGSAGSVAALLRQVGKEKVEAVANHLYRALGRCGAGEDRVRKLLLKRIDAAKSNFAGYGPIIGLTYVGRDARIAREVEKILKKEGVPGGRRGDWRGGGKRALLTWCLTEVGDEKSSAFLREEMMPAVGVNEWAGAIVAFFRAAAECVEGKAESKDAVQQGVRFAVGRGDPSLQDDARRDRDGAGFEPKGDWIGA